MKKTYTARQFFNLINESEEPKKGKGAKNNTQDNKKALKDIETETDKMKGGKKESKPVFGQRQEDDQIYDFNSTTLGYRFDNKPSKAYIDRVLSIARGYAGVEHEKNASKEDYKKEGDFEGNKRFVDQEKKKSNAIEKDRELEKSSGLKASKMPKEKFKSNTVFNEMKLVYKNTFVNEDEIVNMLPESYIVAGNRFIVEDASADKYLVECEGSMYGKDFVKINITKKVCSKNSVNEATDKIQHLMNYSSSDYMNGTSDYQLKENCDDVKFMLDQVRGLAPKADLNNIVKV